ncbi:MAG: hypothetical protein RL757_2230 [Bacteroidota bacterium]|jgi:hypothetical protein
MKLLKVNFMWSIASLAVFCFSNCRDKAPIEPVTVPEKIVLSVHTLKLELGETKGIKVDYWNKFGKKDQLPPESLFDNSQFPVGYGMANDSLFFDRLGVGRVVMIVKVGKGIDSLIIN